MIVRFLLPCVSALSLRYTGSLGETALADSTSTPLQRRLRETICLLRLLRLLRVGAVVNRHRLVRTPCEWVWVDGCGCGCVWVCAARQRRGAVLPRATSPEAPKVSSAYEGPASSLLPAPLPARAPCFVLADLTKHHHNHCNHHHHHHRRRHCNNHCNNRGQINTSNLLHVEQDRAGHPDVAAAAGAAVPGARGLCAHAGLPLVLRRGPRGASGAAG